MEAHLSAAAGPWLVLIGPAGAGKSTLGRGIAHATGRQFVDIDEAGQLFYEQVGWPVPRIYQESADFGWVPTERAWEVARAHAVEQVLSSAAGAVVALGAGHTNYVDSKLFARVRGAVGASEHVLWVEPHADPALSLELLRARNISGRGLDYLHDGHDMLGEWLHDHQAKELASLSHYTHGLSSRKSVNTIVQQLSTGVAVVPLVVTSEA